MSSTRDARPLPLYYQVKQALEREIERMQPGDALATEPELEKRFGVSRITVRRALDELAAEGLIVRQQGRGTFVREPQITHDLVKLRSWTEAMRQLGYEPQVGSCKIEVVEPSHDIRGMLGLGGAERVVHIWRVRLANDEPLCVMSNYVPERLVPNLEREGLKDDSVYATLLAYDLRPVRAEDTVEARPAREREAELLRIPAWSPLLQVTRLSFDPAGNPLEVAVVASRADRYRYTVHFTAE
jgi:GntR family transcriptional regulator